MTIKLPKLFLELIDKEPALRGAIEQTFQEFSPWIESSGLVFFPGYTDHGPKHINEVLQTCASIISDKAREQLTSADVAVLSIAVLLHDCGMHLTKDSFRALIEPGAQRLTIKGFNDKEWSILWEEFLGEVARWDERKLNNIFDDPSPIDVSKFNIDNLSEKDCLIVGEFIRRHHPRLAHEIAIYGVPTKNSTPLKLVNISEELSDLAGLTARSHGLPVRSCYEYLISHYDLREFQGVHAIFLMIVLRIADYIQVHSERASKLLLKVITIKSPISRGEWNAHHSIRDVRSNHEDPEALFIDTKPDNVVTFVKLKRLFNDIQNELDVSWAALGEVYGRYPPLDTLGLTIRRIRSSFDDIRDLSKRISYIPEPCAFDAAGIELLKLLIGPLYGDQIEVGVRELIQNGIDACRELSDIINDDEHENLELSNQEEDVLLVFRIDADGNRWLEITDKGIGMTPSVISDYFLRAGASFRNSEIWKKDHEDEAGVSRVLRGGRFGVGALAAFLIGNEIKVTTRHFREPSSRGVTFVAHLEDEVIQLQYCEAVIGTKISIPINSDTVWNTLVPGEYSLNSSNKNELDHWNDVDWYYLSKPSLSVKYITSESEYILVPEYVHTDAGENLDVGWNRITHKDYKDIQWTYEEFSSVVCNGIRVEDKSSYRHSDVIIDRYISFSWPNISVFDPQGILPLNLQRNDLSYEQVQFRSELQLDVIKDFFAWLLTHAPTDCVTGRKSIHDICKYPGLRLRRKGENCKPFALTRKGMSMISNIHFKALEINCVYILQNADLLKSLSPEDIPENAAVFCYNYSNNEQDILRFYRSALGEDYYADGISKKLKKSLGRIVVTNNDWDLIRKPRAVKKTLVDKTVELFKDDERLVLSNSDSDEKSNELLKFSSLFDGEDKVLIAQWLLTDYDKEVDSDNIDDYWLEILHDSLIPYDKAIWSEKLIKSYESLSNYIESHEKLIKSKK